MKKLTNLLRSKKGQALVETALTLPLLLLVLMGIIEFGRIFNAELIVANASREGARYLALHSTDTQIQTTVQTLTPTLDQSKISVFITPSQASRTSGTAATVEVDYNLQIIAPFVNIIIGNPFKVSSQTTMRVE